MKVAPLIPTRPTRYGAVVRCIYIVGHFFKSALWHTSLLLFAYFLTEICALSAGVMGVTMALALGISAFGDLAIGFAGRRALATPSAAARAQAFGALATATFFILFCATSLLPPSWRTLWALMTLIGFRLFYGLFDVPQSAMVPLMGADDGARRALLVQRNMMSGLASLVVSLVAGPLLIFDRHAGAAFFMVWAIGIGVLASGSAIWLAWSIDDGPGVLPDRARRPLSAQWAFPVILCALAMFTMADSTLRTMEPYIVSFSGASIGVMVWAAIGVVGGQPLWMLLARRMSSDRLLIVFALLLITAAAAFAGPMRNNSAVTVLIWLFFGMATGGIWLLMWEAMTAIAAGNHTTLYVGTFTCASKLSQALAMFLLGRVFEAAPYRSTLSDPWSLPSLWALGAIVTLAALCLVFVAIAWWPRQGAPAPDRRT